MRHALVALTLALAPLAAPQVAAAGPLTLGVNLGLTQSELDADAGIDASGTMGLFGRLAFTPWLAGQLEVSRVHTEDPGVEIRKATALVIVELGRGGRLVPTLSAGIGIDRADTAYGHQVATSHIEGGFGLEYRADGGLTIGADVRLGGRSLDEPMDGIAYPADVRGSTAHLAPVPLRDGEYRAARLMLGLRF